MNKKIKFNPLKGYQFVFEDGENKIEAVFSMTGMEKIFANGEMVINQRSMSLGSQNTITIDGLEYLLTLHNDNVLTGPTTCTLHKNGVAIQRQRMHHPEINQKGLWPLAVVVGLSLGILDVHFGVPKAATSAILAVAFVCVAIYKLKPLFSSVTLTQEHLG